jgi:hypothetical protein
MPVTSPFTHHGPESRGHHTADRLPNRPRAAFSHTNMRVSNAQVTNTVAASNGRKHLSRHTGSATSQALTLRLNPLRPRVVRRDRPLPRGNTTEYAGLPVEVSVLHQMNRYPSPPARLGERHPLRPVSGALCAVMAWPTDWPSRCQASARELANDTWPSVRSSCDRLRTRRIGARLDHRAVCGHAALGALASQSYSRPLPWSGELGHLAEALRDQDGAAAYVAGVEVVDG